MQKQIVNDVGSALLEEAVNQLNNSAVPYTVSMNVAAAGTEGNFCFANLTTAYDGFWLKDIVVALNWGVGAIAAQTTSFEVQGMNFGQWAGHAPTVYFERSDFRAPNSIAAGDLIFSLHGLNAGVETGVLPLWIPAPNQLRFYVWNAEGAVAFNTLEVTIWGCPVRDKLVFLPNYTQKLRSFQTT